MRRIKGAAAVAAAGLLVLAGSASAAAGDLAVGDLRGTMDRTNAFGLGLGLVTEPWRVAIDAHDNRGEVLVEVSGLTSPVGAPTGSHTAQVTEMRVDSADLEGTPVAYATVYATLDEPAMWLGREVDSVKLYLTDWELSTDPQDSHASFRFYDSRIALDEHMPQLAGGDGEEGSLRIQDGGTD